MTPRRPARPVHYAAHGIQGIAFDCYYREQRARNATEKKVEKKMGTGNYSAPVFVYSVPTPRRHTDLTKVTCPECWGTIRKMADKALGLR